MKFNKIKPCPCCGVTPQMQTSLNIYYEKMYYIDCLNKECKIKPMTGYYFLEIEAIEAWNTIDKWNDEVKEAIKHRTEEM